MLTQEQIQLEKEQLRADLRKLIKQKFICTIDDALYHNFSQVYWTELPSNNWVYFYNVKVSNKHETLYSTDDRVIQLLKDGLLKELQQEYKKIGVSLELKHTKYTFWKRFLIGVKEKYSLHIGKD